MTVAKYPEFDIAARDINRAVIEKGHRDQERSMGDTLMLIVCEISEALEEHRNGHAPDEIYFEVVESFFAFIDEFGNQDTFLKGTFVPYGVYTVLMANNKDVTRYLKPEGIPIEMADAIIRILENMYNWGISPTLALSIKMMFNETRPYRHGKVNL